MELDGPIRLDGRLENQLRPFVSEQFLLNRADGSAKFAQDKTCVLVAVYGPVEVKPNKELIDRAAVEVTFKPKSGIAGVNEKPYEQYIRKVFENVILTTLHPRTSIQIIVQVLHDDGALLACAINATCLALMDAGIAMKGLACATSAILTSDTRLLLDPTAIEEKDAKAVFTVTFDSKKKEVLGVSSLGSFDQDDLFTAVESCRKGSEKVFAFARLSLERRFAKEKSMLGAR
eukprot:Colp12_sorted_trinity150504_noHs@18515